MRRFVIKLIAISAPYTNNKLKLHLNKVIL